MRVFLVSAALILGAVFDFLYFCIGVRWHDSKMLLNCLLAALCLAVLAVVGL